MKDTSGDDSDAPIDQIITDKPAAETDPGPPPKMGANSLLESRIRQPRGPLRVSSSRGQHPRHYVTHLRSEVFLRSYLPCLVRVSCPTGSPSTPVQAVGIKRLFQLRKQLHARSLIRASCHLPPSGAFNNRRPTCRDQSLRSPTLMTIFWERFLSTASEFPLTAASSVFICLPLASSRRASKKRVDSSVIHSSLQLAQLHISFGHRRHLYLQEPSHSAAGHHLFLWPHVCSHLVKNPERIELLQCSGSVLPRAQRG